MVTGCTPGYAVIPASNALCKTSVRWLPVICLESAAMPTAKQSKPFSSERSVSPAPKASKRASAPAAGTGITTTFDPDSEGDLDLPEGFTVLDYAFLLDPERAQHVAAVRVNGKAKPLDAVPVPGDDLEYYFAPQPVVNHDWLGLVKWGAARKVILHALPLTGRPAASYPLREASPTDQGNSSVPKKPTDDAKREITRPEGYVQPNRQGKKLIGAYVDKADAARLKEVLKEQGLTVQEFFSFAVEQALAASATPAQRKKLASEGFKRNRAALLASLGK